MVNNYIEKENIFSNDVFFFCYVRERGILCFEVPSKGGE